MGLRITRARFDPTTYDEGLRLSREATAAVRQLPGFQHIHQGADRTAGTVAVVSTWATADQAQFSRDALGDVLARLQALGVQFEPPEIYEVID